MATFPFPFVSWVRCRRNGCRQRISEYRFQPPEALLCHGCLCPSCPDCSSARNAALRDVGDLLTQLEQVPFLPSFFFSDWDFSLSILFIGQFGTWPHGIFPIRGSRRSSASSMVFGCSSTWGYFRKIEIKLMPWSFLGLRYEDMRILFFVGVRWKSCTRRAGRSAPTTRCTPARR